MFPAGAYVAVGEHILAPFDYRQFGYLSPYRSPALYFEKRVGGYRPIFVYGQVKVNYRDELILEQLRPNLQILKYYYLLYYTIEIKNYSTRIIHVTLKIMFYWSVFKIDYMFKKIL